MRVKPFVYITEALPWLASIKRSLQGGSNAVYTALPYALDEAVRATAPYLYVGAVYKYTQDWLLEALYHHGFDYPDAKRPLKAEHLRRAKLELAEVLESLINQRLVSNAFQTVDLALLPGHRLSFKFA